MSESNPSPNPLSASLHIIPVTKFAAAYGDLLRAHVPPEFHINIQNDDYFFCHGMDTLLRFGRMPLVAAPVWDSATLRDAFAIIHYAATCVFQQAKREGNRPDVVRVSSQMHSLVKRQLVILQSLGLDMGLPKAPADITPADTSPADTSPADTEGSK